MILLLDYVGMPDPKNYTIDWISTIFIEYIAAQEFLDEEHEGPDYVSLHDNNDDALGRIGQHNVVIVQRNRQLHGRDQNRNLRGH